MYEVAAQEGGVTEMDLAFNEQFLELVRHTYDDQTARTVAVPKTKIVKQPTQQQIVPLG